MVVGSLYKDHIVLGLSVYERKERKKRVRKIIKVSSSLSSIWFSGLEIYFVFLWFHSIMKFVWLILIIFVGLHSDIRVRFIVRHVCINYINDAK